MNTIPTYTQESKKEKLEQDITNVWPRIYRFINGIFYSIVHITRNTVIGIINQIFH